MKILKIPTLKKESDDEPFSVSQESQSQILTIFFTFQVFLLSDCRLFWLKNLRDFWPQEIVHVKHSTGPADATDPKCWQRSEWVFQFFEMQPVLSSIFLERLLLNAAIWTVYIILWNGWSTVEVEDILISMISIYIYISLYITISFDSRIYIVINIHIFLLNTFDSNPWV